jgi:hypothetical protein
MKKTGEFAVGLLLLFAAGTLSSAASTTPIISVRSPNGLVRIEFVLQRHEKTEAVPHYRVYYKDQLIVSDSRLGVELADGPPLGGSCLIESVQTRSYHISYTMVPGKRRQVIDHCAEAVITLREQSTPPPQPSPRVGGGQRWEVVL